MLELIGYVWLTTAGLFCVYAVAVMIKLLMRGEL